MRQFFYVLLPLFLTGPFSMAQISNEANVLSEIERINKDINELLKAGKFEQAGAYFAEDVTQLVTGQQPITSREAWIEFQKRASQIGEWDLQLEVLELEVSGHVAVERGRGVQTFTANDKSPMPSFTSTGDYMVLWKSNDGKWMIQWDYVVLQDN